jgi:hypothetical protein
MTHMMKAYNQSLLPLTVFCFLLPLAAQTIPAGVAIDANVGNIMAKIGAKGMAVAAIDYGKVAYVHAYGIRNAKGDVRTDTVMYGASLAKTVFAYLVMQLVDEGKLNLDTSIRLISTNHYRAMVPIRFFRTSMDPTNTSPMIHAGKRSHRGMCLTHSTGFSNFWFLESDQKLHIHFDPGMPLQLFGRRLHIVAVRYRTWPKEQGLGLDVGDLVRADFGRLGMPRTSLACHEGQDNFADGWN